MPERGVDFSDSDCSEQVSRSDDVCHPSWEEGETPF